MMKFWLWEPRRPSMPRATRASGNAVSGGRDAPVRVLAGIFLVGALTGCAGNAEPPRLETAARGAACLDDSRRCVSIRQARLSRMRADASYGWVYDPDSRPHYATGVKLFAYDLTRKQLDCSQLGHAIAETSEAKGWLTSAQPGISSEQLTRARLLNDDVHNRLRKTHRKKGCRRIARR